jgi:hypothetical protein
MLDQLLPEVKANMTTVASWLWEQYGKKALEKAPDVPPAGP